MAGTTIEAMGMDITMDMAITEATDGASLAASWTNSAGVGTTDEMEFIQWIIFAFLILDFPTQ